VSKLQTLYDLLRDQSKWPLGFEWDYGNNSKCALGLAVETGLMRREEIFNPAAFDLAADEWQRIFHTPMPSTSFRESGYTDVKPSTVARRIARHLNSRAKELAW
jgi:hypothetical protein